jgi:hypothetical protein
MLAVGWGPVSSFFRERHCSHSSFWNPYQSSNQVPTTRTPTLIKYTVIPGIEEEEEAPKEIEVPTSATTHDANGGPGSLASYRDIDDAEADKEMNVDA